MCLLANKLSPRYNKVSILFAESKNYGSFVVIASLFLAVNIYSEALKGLANRKAENNLVEHTIPAKVAGFGPIEKIFRSIIKLVYFLLNQRAADHLL